MPRRKLRPQKIEPLNMVDFHSTFPENVVFTLDELENFSENSDRESIIDLDDEPIENLLSKESDKSSEKSLDKSLDRSLDRSLEKDLENFVEKETDKGRNLDDFSKFRFFDQDFDFSIFQFLIKISIFPYFDF